MSLCPSCGSTLLQPLRSRPGTGGDMLVDLRCPEFELPPGSPAGPRQRDPQRQNRAVAGELGGWDNDN